MGRPITKTVTTPAVGLSFTSETLKKTFILIWIKLADLSYLKEFPCLFILIMNKMKLEKKFYPNAQELEIMCSKLTLYILAADQINEAIFLPVELKIYFP